MFMQEADGVEYEGSSIENVENLSDIEQETETPAESSPENNQAETPAESSPTGQQPDAGQPGQQTPFHEDPKVLDYINRQVEKRLKEQSQTAPPKPQTEAAEIPAWFAGDRNDPQTHAAWKAYAAHQEQLVTQAQDAAYKRLKSEQEAETKRVKDAQEWFQKEIADIEGETKTPLSDSDRNRLMKFVYDNYIVDDQGRWSYKKAFQFMKAMEKATQPDPKVQVNKRKEIVGKTQDGGTPESKDSGVVTAEQARRMSWD